MSCKIKVNMPCLIGEAIEESLKKMNLYRNTDSSKIYLNNGSFFIWNNSENKYDLEWEDFYRKGQSKEITEFKEKFFPIYEEEVIAYNKREAEKARLARLEFIKAKKEEAIKIAKSMGYGVVEKKDGNKQVLVLTKY